MAMRSLWDWLTLQRVPEWETGKLSNGVTARRNRRTGRVEFQLWKAGQHGHVNGYWHVVGSGWAETFKPD